MRFSLSIILVLLFLTSCKLASFGGTSKSLQLEPILGTVGSFRTTLTSDEFVEVGLPVIDKKIRVSFEKDFFTKRELRQYNNKIISDDQKLQIVDSIDFNPSFYRLEISDKVGLISAINSSSNKNLANYIEITADNVIITSVSIYFPPEISGLIDKAAELYLVQGPEDSASLEILGRDGKSSTVGFREGTSFNFEFSAFCWTENYKREVVIAAFRERENPCPGKTEKKAKNASSEDLFEKL